MSDQFTPEFIEHHDQLDGKSYRESAIDNYADALAALKSRDAEIERHLSDGLRALAGAVCTPEKGYKVDGGLGDFIADVKELRKQYERLTKRVAELRHTLCRIREGFAEIDLHCDAIGYMKGEYDTTPITPNMLGLVVEFQENTKGSP